MAARAARVSVTDVNALSSEDRIAVMQMVAEGEINLDEAIDKVLNQVQGKKGKMNRRGGMKKFRGRLDLELRIQRASAFSVVCLEIKKGRDFMSIGKHASNPFVRAEMRLSSQGTAKSNKYKVHTTEVHKDTNNPIINQQFSWELRSPEAGHQTEFSEMLAQMHIVISVENRSNSVIKRLSSQKSVIGTMAFSVFDMWEAGETFSGWYKLLDEVKGQYQNAPYRHNRPIQPPSITNVKTPPGSTGPSSRSESPEPNSRSSRPKPPPIPTSAAPEVARPPPPKPPSVSTRPAPPITPKALRQNSNPFLTADGSVSTPAGAESNPFNPFEAPVRAMPATPVVPPAAQANPFLDDFDGFGDAFPDGADTASTRNTSRQRPPPPPAPKTKSNLSESMSAAAPPMRVTVDSFNYLSVLGQGSFGKVVMAERKSDSEVYAIKIIRKESVLEDDDVESTMTERRVLEMGFESPFLTKLFATFQTGEKLFYVMEMITGGDLMFHIQNDQVFALDRARFYAAEISLGLWFLHAHGIIYRDLKLDNVMLDKDGHVKIADFGMCKEGIFGQARTTTFCGTPGYLAPEIIREKPYSFSVDWWSLGVLTYEMCIGDSPFDADDDEELFHLIQTYTPPFHKSFDKSAKSLILGMMTRDPEKRLGCGKYGKQDLQGHPFYASIDWATMERRGLKPPFVPKQSGKKEASNFDSEFTQENPQISPDNKRRAAMLDQVQFKGFSFSAPVFAGRQHDKIIVAKVTPQNLLEGKSWYRPDLTRSQVTQALKNKPTGTFLIRESTTQPGCYALAMHAGAGAPWNGLITPSVDKLGRTQYQMFAGRKFPNLNKLIEHYSNTPVTKDMDGTPVALRP